MRKALMITYYFPPVIYGTSLRVMNFTKKLKEFNWFPTIVTMNYRIFPYLKDFSFSETVKESGARVYGVNLMKPMTHFARLNFPEMKKNLIFRISSLFSKIFLPVEPESIWRKQALKIGERILKSEKFDLIVSFAPPITNIVIGAQLSSKFNIPLIIDYSFIPNPVSKSFEKVEKKFLKKGFSFIADNRKVKDHLLQKYSFLDYNEVKIIPTGVDLGEFKSSRLQLNDKFVITFATGRANLRKMRPVLNAIIHLLKKHPEIKDRFMFNLIGVPSADVLNFIAKNGLKSNASIFININRESYITLLASSTFLLYIEDNDIVNVPYDYIGAGKPLISLLNSEANYRYIIGGYKNAITGIIHNQSSVISAFEKAFEMFNSGKILKPSYEIENFDIDKVIVNLVREFESFTTD